MKTVLIFVRHAEAEGNIKRVFHGWTDGKLTPKGHKQAQRVAERLKAIPVDVIYSSSLTRTMQTAEYIAKAKNLPIIRTDRLKEINGGDWEGRTWEELPLIWEHEYDTWENRPHMHKMPNGESMAEFQERLLGEVEYIVKNNQGKNICIVTHGTAIKSMMCRFHGCKLDEMVSIPWYDNTAVTLIEHEDGSYRPVLEGDTSHLGGELGTIENQTWWNEYMEKLNIKK